MRAFWPDKLSHYSQRELLGAGRYGLVYRVYNPVLEKTTVIKLIEATQIVDKVVLKRFKQEIKSLQRVKSSHVVRILDHWIEPEFIAFEMEYIAGLSLERLMTELKSIPGTQKQELILNIVRQICEGLTALHRLDLVHRDLKPSNVLIQSEGIGDSQPAHVLLRKMTEFEFLVKISDLGVIKDLSASVSFTRTNDFIGTAAYVSPEQATGKRTDTTSDIYSLGVMWYEMLAGTNPFHRKNIYLTISAHIQEEPPNIQSLAPEVPLDIAHVLMLLLQKDPQQRFYTARRLFQMLEQRQQSQPRGKYDISLLIENQVTGQKECAGYHKFIRNLKDKQKESRVILATYRKEKEKNHLSHHFANHSAGAESRFFHYIPNAHPDIYHSFASALVQRLSRKERDEFQQKLPLNSLERELLELFSITEYYKSSDFIRLKFNKIPSFLKIYNWIKFVAELLKFYSNRSSLVIFLDSPDRLFPYYSSVFINLANILKDAQVSWVFLVPENQRDEIRKEWTNHLIPGVICLDDFFSGENICHISSRMINNRTWQSLAGSGNAKIPDDSNSFSAIVTKEESDFLQYLALAGQLSPIQYVNWLLEKHFNRNGEMVISLFRKELLQELPDVPGKIAFRNPGDFKFALNMPDAGERENKIRSVIDFWEGQNNPESRELLFDLLAQLKESSRAAHLLVELLDYYGGIFDVKKQRLLLERADELFGTFKMPAGLSVHFRISEIELLTVQGKAKEAAEAAKNAYSRLSDKYSLEKKKLVFYLYANSLLAGEISEAEKTWEEVKSSGKIFPHQSGIMAFLSASGALIRGNLDSAAKKMSEALMLLSEKGDFWYIPCGSFLLAHTYTRKNEWKTAYEYAAMALQAGRVLNDFWVMDQCLQLIEKNSYYLSNREKLKDWGLYRKEYLDFPFRLLAGQDVRNRILDFIR